MSPKFGFFKRKTSDNLREKKSQTNSIQTVTEKELLEIVEKEKNLLERDLISDLEPTRRSVIECLDRLRTGADELEKQEIKVESPQFESLINNSKRILITSIKKESLIDYSEIRRYEEAVKFKNNLELLINRFGQVGDSHNRILNEFMGKKINKLKNEFENLSSSLTQVTRILSVKESEINKCIACIDDLIILRDKFNERNDKQNRLSEIIEENDTIDKNIETSKSEFQDFQKSEEILQTTGILQKINSKKNELNIFERNFNNMISNLSRPITKFSYQASKETQGKLAILENEPLEIFSESSQFIKLFSEIRKNIVDKDIQIKDPEKTIHQLDEIINSFPSLSSTFNNLKNELNQLESAINSKHIRQLEEMKARTEIYEKYRSDNNALSELTETSIYELDSAINDLKKKIEDSIESVTNIRYTLMQSES